MMLLVEALKLRLLLSSASTDAKYHSIAIDQVNLSITSDDNAGYVVAPTTLVTLRMVVPVLMIWQ